MINKINHLAIAVNDLQRAIPYYRDILQLEYLGSEVVEEQKVRVAIFKVGAVNIELLEPISADSPVAKFLAKKGQGLHHVAFQTDDLPSELRRLRKQQIELIDNEPRQGAHQTQIAFLHPRSSGGVLTELCQINDSTKSSD